MSVMTPDEINERRAKARRSAIVLGIVALAIFVGSIILKAAQN
ncbi:MAG: hypothetical protein ACJ8OJ_19295 [Povalibacter sp.]